MALSLNIYEYHVIANKFDTDGVRTVTNTLLNITEYLPVLEKISPSLQLLFVLDNPEKNTFVDIFTNSNLVLTCRTNIRKRSNNEPRYNITIYKLNEKYVESNLREKDILSSEIIHKHFSLDICTIVYDRYIEIANSTLTISTSDMSIVPVPNVSIPWYYETSAFQYYFDNLNIKLPQLVTITYMYNIIENYLLENKLIFYTPTKVYIKLPSQLSLFLNAYSKTMFYDELLSTLVYALTDYDRYHYSPEKGKGTKFYISEQNYKSFDNTKFEEYENVSFRCEQFVSEETTINRKRVHSTFEKECIEPEKTIEDNDSTVNEDQNNLPKMVLEIQPSKLTLHEKIFVTIVLIYITVSSWDFITNTNIVCNDDDVIVLKNCITALYISVISCIPHCWTTEEGLFLKSISKIYLMFGIVFFLVVWSGSMITESMCNNIENHWNKFFSDILHDIVYEEYMMA